MGIPIYLELLDIIWKSLIYFKNHHNLIELLLPDKKKKQTKKKNVWMRMCSYVSDMWTPLHTSLSSPLWFVKSLYLTDFIIPLWSFGEIRS